LSGLGNLFPPQKEIFLEKKRKPTLVAGTNKKNPLSPKHNTRKKKKTQEKNCGGKKNKKRGGNPKRAPSRSKI